MDVKDVMLPDPISVYRRDHVREVMDLIRNHKIGQVPVIDESGRLVGIITRRDLEPRNDGMPSRTADLRAEDVMTRDVVTIIPGADLCEAAILLNHYGFRALPVVVGDRVVGIISKNVVSEWMRELSGQDNRHTEPAMPVNNVSRDNPVAAA